MTLEMLVVIVASVLAATVLVQAVLAIGFCLKLSRFHRTLLADERCPPAMVVLCLRGSDPFLVRCLEAILAQDYPRFELRIVVDHVTDPARSVAEEVLSRCGGARAQIEPLLDRKGTCSLKCSSLIQAAASCDDAVAFLAQLDADTIPHSSWLRELATALADEGVGAATGNRWYMPQQVTWGTLARYAWNAAAIVQMFWYRIAWGGTLAIRMNVIREAGLLERWGRAFCEDTMLFQLLKERCWSVAFVPSLMMINRESCDVAGFCRWISRQLLTARLYHPRWPAVAVHGFGTTAALLLALGTLGYLLAARQLSLAVPLIAGLAFYQASMLVLLMPMEWLVRRIARARGEPTQWLSFGTFCRVVLAIPLTQLLYPGCLLAAIRLRQVDWRGVAYQIRGPWNIRLLEYRPYAAQAVEAEPSAASL